MLEEEGEEEAEEEEEEVEEEVSRNRLVEYMRVMCAERRREALGWLQ